MPPLRPWLLSGLLTLAAAGPGAAQKPNRLADETSPYLRQHAHNPVDWYPWGPEAFARAKKEGKLVFLSIGYSSCHWCHVMERESFSNAAVAEILNKHFVCIKVDREERPDVDEVYMTALQVAGESGGWPLSMFLTPEGKPIFGGTYWPPEDKEVGGEKVPGFKSVLKKVIDLDKEKHKELLAQADKIAEMTTESLERNNRIAPLVPLTRELVADAAASFEIDPEYGGFGSRARGFRGAKFPRPPALALLLRQSAKPGFEKVAKGVKLTLEQMAAGGIFDQIGGGFHRYSTERTWTVPHFEKMLYDNAQLLEIYADAYKADPNPEYRRVVRQTVAFVSREMTSDDGAFYSALDADSEGREGAYYVWTAKQAATALVEPEDVALGREVFGLKEPNFEKEFIIPTRRVPLAAVARERKQSEEKVEEKVSELRYMLFGSRAHRPRPFLDTKVLTGWNGLMIAAYARAGEVFETPGLVKAAEKAAGFVLAKLRDKNGRLLRVYAAKPGAAAEARGPAFLEDYAFLVHGLLNLHDATHQAKWLDEAKALTDQMIKWHGDDRGGFFTTASDGEKMFARGKDYYDGAQPSGNGMAARNLVRLYDKTRDEKYKSAAERTIKQFAAVLRTQPQAVPLTADALDRYLDLPARK